MKFKGRLQSTRGENSAVERPGSNSVFRRKRSSNCGSAETCSKKQRALYRKSARNIRNSNDNVFNFVRYVQIWMLQLSSRQKLGIVS